MWSAYSKLIHAGLHDFLIILYYVWVEEVISVLIFCVKTDFLELILE